MMDRLAAIVGRDNVARGAEAQHGGVDGQVPRGVVAPANTGELQEVLAFADAEGLAVTPEANGQLLHLGNPPSRLDIIVSMRRFSEVVSYEPMDLTATAQSGAGLSSLAARLLSGGQFWPLAPPMSEAHSVGGVVAADASGPHRLRYGRARDLVLGVEAVLAGGEVVRSGGTVVKNVAGYDLLKLFVGSLGTLGVITELSLRLQPLPECVGATLFFLRSWVEAEDVAASLLASPIALASLDALNLPAARAIARDLEAQGIALPSDAAAVLAVGLDGMEVDVEHQLVTAAALGPGVPDHVSIFRGGPAGPVRRSLRDLPCTVGPALVSARISIASSGIADSVAPIEAIGAARGWTTAVQAYMGSGVVNVVFLGGDEARPEPDELAAACLELRGIARGAGGHCVIERAPAEVKRAVDAWGLDGPQAELMRSIKRALDPNGILSPGRFVGGI